MKVYTKTGDKGETSLFNGDRVSKSHPRIETYGTLDELTSHLGMVVALLPANLDQLKNRLIEIQKLLFNAGALLATPQNYDKPDKLPPFSAANTTQLEKDIDMMNESLPKQTAFIISGGHSAAASSHIARTVCRRMERLLVNLISSEMENPERVALFLAFVNRLSDYLFVVSRFVNHETGNAEINWES